MSDPTQSAKFRADLAAAKAAKGPTGTQRSSIVPELSGHGVGLPGWSHFMPAERELSDRWVGHKRVETVEEMCNHWQVAAVRQVIRLPVHRYVIEFDPGDLDPVATELCAADLDVPLLGAPDEQRPGRRANRFSARRHLDRALDALDYGHAVFEQAGRLDEAGYWRLTDLAPVPQWTISDQNSWEIDRHGRVLKVIQWGANPPVQIPVDHLVTFTWQGKPGDPRGRSMLRPLTGAWVLSDRLVRVMGMSGERTGMGIPVGKVGTAAVPGAKEKMEQLLAGLAAGHDTNLVLETDEDITKSVMLMGVTGQTPDIVSMLRFLDDVMARAMLAMLLQLNQAGSGGSYALGLTFDALLAMFHDTVIDWYCDVMSEQIVERWVDRNRGEEFLADGAMPRLVWSRRDDEDEDEDAPVPPPEQVDVDAPPPLAARRGRERGTAARARRALRARQAGALSARGAVPALTEDAMHTGAAATSLRASFATVAGRDLRRDPSPVELAAATDFAAIEAQFVATRQSITNALLAIRDELAGVAVEQVAAMEQVDPLTLGDTLATILEAHAAEEMDAAPLVALLVAFAVAGVHQVIGEAARQGVGLDADIDYSERAVADAADLMRRMARQVAESSASAARTGLAAGVAGQPAANVIAEHLGSLTPAAAEQAAAGAASRAQNAGRAAAIEAGNPEVVAASELLDPATCGNCLLNDGHEYASVADGLEDYPMGGYRRCEGMERCRGMLVAVFASDGVLLSSSRRETATFAAALERYGLAARFDPNQPRDADGRWTDSIGNVMRIALPADRERMSLPPAWTDVLVAAEGHEDQDLQALGTDAKGRTQRVYSPEHDRRQAALKFQRISELDGVIGALDAALDDPQDDHHAALKLIRRTGMRPGSDSDTGADKDAYGATNLRVRHVTIDGDRVRLQFTGKKGVDLDFTFDDPELAALLAPRLAGKGDDDHVFATSPAQVRAALKAVIGGYKVKDLRTYRASRLARDLVAAEPVPTTAAERRAARNRVGDAVAAVLGNTRAVALASYIDPAVFAPWDIGE